MRAKRMAIGDNYYNGSQYCWHPAACGNRIDGTSSPCWPNCNTDLVVQGNVGIGTTQPQAKLDVAGKIKVGDDTSTPTAGVIRWTGTDFEGYDGTQWVSLSGGLSSTTFTNPTKTLGGTSYPLCMTSVADGTSAQMVTINQFCSGEGYEFGELFNLVAEGGYYVLYYNGVWAGANCGTKALSVKCFK